MERRARMESGFENVRQRVLRYIRGYTQDASSAEDALQEAFLRFLESHPRVSEEEKIVSWLIVVARRFLIDEHRKNDTHSHSAIDTGSEALPDEDIADAVAFRMAVRQSWENLTARDKTLLKMRESGYNVHEIADTLNLSSDTVKKSIQRARRRFQNRLMENGLGDLFTGVRKPPRHRPSLDTGQGGSKRPGER